jgi:hypothetical protein
MTTTETETERALRSVEDMAEEGIEEEEGGQLAIAGTQPKLTLEVGGTKPNVSVAKIKALKLPVRNADDPEHPGQFRKGDRVRAVVDLVCVDLQFPDERRKGKVERTQRVHVFEPLAVEVVETLDE